MDDWGGYRGLKPPPSLPPSPGSKPLSALMWKNSKNPWSAWICSLGPQAPLTAHPLHLCGAMCSLTSSVIMTLPHFERRARVRFCVSVSQTGLVVHAARWSYVNRAVSHLLWPGWESSGGPGSLWVPDLHVIHSRLGGGCPNPNSEKREGGGQEEKRRGRMEREWG